MGWVKIKKIFIYLNFLILEYSNQRSLSDIHLDLNGGESFCLERCSNMYKLKVVLWYTYILTRHPIERLWISSQKDGTFFGLLCVPKDLVSLLKPVSRLATAVSVSHFKCRLAKSSKAGKNTGKRRQSVQNFSIPSFESRPTKCPIISSVRSFSCYDLQTLHKFTHSMTHPTFCV